MYMVAAAAVSVAGDDIAATCPAHAAGSDSSNATASVRKANPCGRTLHCGVREHAIGAILNGIALQGPTRP
jgi:transketolase